MEELIGPVVRLDKPEPMRPETLPPGLPEVDEHLARRELRRQIGSMERQLGALHVDAHPRHGLRFQVAGSGGPRILSLEDLERLRDSLAARVQDVRRSLTEQGYVQERKRDQLRQMLLAPERHKWARISSEDLGDPGCRHWHSRPLLGPLGMLFGWWRVKVSSGCPLP